MNNQKSFSIIFCAIKYSGVKFMSMERTGFPAHADMNQEEKKKFLLSCFSFL
jgi:hypothetical protein